MLMMDFLLQGIHLTKSNRFRAFNGKSNRSNVKVLRKFQKTLDKIPVMM